MNMFVADHTKLQYVAQCDFKHQYGGKCLKIFKKKEVAWEKINVELKKKKMLLFLGWNANWQALLCSLHNLNSKIHTYIWPHYSIVPESCQELLGNKSNVLCIFWIDGNQNRAPEEAHSEEDMKVQCDGAVVYKSV